MKIHLGFLKHPAVKLLSIKPVGEVAEYSDEKEPIDQDEDEHEHSEPYPKAAALLMGFIFRLAVFF